MNEGFIDKLTFDLIHLYIYIIYMSKYIYIYNIYIYLANIFFQLNLLESYTCVKVSLPY